MMTPDGSAARIFILDSNGHLLSESTLQTGWCINVIHAAWECDCGHGFLCVKVSAGGRDCLHIYSQYYALLDGTFALGPPRE